MKTSTPRLITINLNQKTRELTLEFENNQTFILTCEYLRVFSPSAEVRGHTPEQATLQTGKENVNITDIESVGSYAVRLHFDDGHNTGLYAWEYLYQLGLNQTYNWQNYLGKLKAEKQHSQIIDQS